MRKLVSCITNKLFLNEKDDSNKLYIVAVINNMYITWHTVNIKYTNIEQLKEIYDYFKKKYNKNKIIIQHYEECELYNENLTKLISLDSKALYVKIYFE